MSHKKGSFSHRCSWIMLSFSKSPLMRKSSLAERNHGAPAHSCHSRTRQKSHNNFNARDFWNRHCTLPPPFPQSVTSKPVPKVYVQILLSISWYSCSSRVEPFSWFAVIFIRSPLSCYEPLICPYHRASDERLVDCRYFYKNIE